MCWCAPQLCRAVATAQSLYRRMAIQYIVSTGTCDVCTSASDHLTWRGLVDHRGGLQPSVRKQHNAGFKHKANVRAYFLQFEQQETEDMLTKKMADNFAMLGQPGSNIGQPGGPRLPPAGLLRPPMGGPPMGGPPMGGRPPPMMAPPGGMPGPPGPPGPGMGPPGGMYGGPPPHMGPPPGMRPPPGQYGAPY
jgi:U1 small nuclear ribonucleoprotein C